MYCNRRGENLLINRQSYRWLFNMFIRATFCGDGCFKKANNKSILYSVSENGDITFHSRRINHWMQRRLHIVSVQTEEISGLFIINNLASWIIRLSDSSIGHKLIHSIVVEATCRILWTTVAKVSRLWMWRCGRHQLACQWRGQRINLDKCSFTCYATRRPRLHWRLQKTTRTTHTPSMSLNIWLARW